MGPRDTRLALRTSQRRRCTQALALLGLAALLAVPGRALWRLTRTARLVRLSRPYKQQPATARHSLLVVGDSTAVGTGASAPIHSVAGLIGRAFPDLAIENRGRDGATLADLMQQMREGDRYDLLLIQAGGNDIMRLRDLDAMYADIDRVLHRARELAPLVVLMPCGNVGNAPFFFPPLSWWMTQRSRALQRSCAELAHRHGARYVNLFREREDDPFARNPALNAPDGLHPSDAGYAQWWQELRTQAELSSVLGRSQST